MNVQHTVRWRWVLRKAQQCKQSGVGLSFRGPRKASDTSLRSRPEGRTGAAVRMSAGRALEGEGRVGAQVLRGPCVPVCREQ